MVQWQRQQLDSCQSWWPGFSTQNPRGGSREPTPMWFSDFHVCTSTQIHTHAINRKNLKSFKKNSYAYIYIYKFLISTEAFAVLFPSHVLIFQRILSYWVCLLSSCWEFYNSLTAKNLLLKLFLWKNSLTPPHLLGFLFYYFILFLLFLYCVVRSGGLCTKPVWCWAVSLQVTPATTHTPLRRARDGSPTSMQEAVHQGSRCLREKQAISSLLTGTSYLKDVCLWSRWRVRLCTEMAFLAERHAAGWSF